MKRLTATGLLLLVAYLHTVFGQPKPILLTLTRFYLLLFVVTPNNEASRNLFASFGRRHNAQVAIEENHFPASAFPSWAEPKHGTKPIYTFPEFRFLFLLLSFEEKNNDFIFISIHSF